MKFGRNARLLIYPQEALTGYWYVGHPDFAEMTFLERFLKPGDIFYDAGANAGALSIFAADLGCHVVAFEPIPKTFSRLQENVHLNAPNLSIEPLNLALGSNEEKLVMTTEFGSGNHVLEPGDGSPSVEVPATTLDKVIKTRPSPNFLKVDVEGHELEVIKGAASLLKSSELLGLMMETFRPHNWRLKRLQELEALLGEHGFTPFDFDPVENKITPLKMPFDGHNNTFYFRNLGQVAERLNMSSPAE